MEFTMLKSVIFAYLMGIIVVFLALHQTHGNAPRIVSAQSTVVLMGVRSDTDTLDPLVAVVDSILAYQYNNKCGMYREEEK
jgi:hypothetical protein